MVQPVVLGGSGFVGREITDHLGCPATSMTGRDGLARVDATNLEELRRLLRNLAPSILINCVGLADVDRAEREPGVADALNRQVVANLAELQPELGFRLVHISTDYVFDGNKGSYREGDLTHPINEYGRSKLRGEEAALRSAGALVVRISSPFGRGFGARKPQFFRYVTDSLRSGKPVKALTDQRVTATFLPDLARAIETLTGRSVSGVVHVGSAEPLTRFEFAQTVARTLEVDPKLVIPGLRSEMTQWTAARPNDTSLNVESSQRYGVTYTPVGAALSMLLSGS
jgi:dTDP-4-dehydrorhamnose reductase